jgi:hypothetical protein
VSSTQGIFAIRQKFFDEILGYERNQLSKLKNRQKKACSMSRQDIFQASLSGKYITALAENLAYPCKNTDMLLESKHAKKAIQRLMDDGN